MVSSYSRPECLVDAIALLAASPAGTRLVAGGTDLMVELRRGIKPAERLIDLTGLADELDFIEDDGEHLTLGALVTHNRVISARRCRANALPLVQACLEIGAPQIRTRATVAGNLVTASPANDTITALFALDAVVDIVGPTSRRTLDVAAFCTGFRSTALAAGELVRAISVRKTTASRRGIFLKLGLRGAQAISVVNVAAVVEFDGTQVRDARIALGWVAPTIVRARGAEAALTGTALDPDGLARAARAAPRTKPRRSTACADPPATGATQSRHSSRVRSRRSRAARKRPNCRNVPSSSKPAAHSATACARTRWTERSPRSRRPSTASPIISSMRRISRCSTHCATARSSPVRRKAAPRASAGHAPCGSTERPSCRV